MNSSSFNQMPCTRISNSIFKIRQSRELTKVCSSKYVRNIPESGLEPPLAQNSDFLEILGPSCWDYQIKLVLLYYYNAQKILVHSIRYSQRYRIPWYIFVKFFMRSFFFLNFFILLPNPPPTQVVRGYVPDVYPPIFYRGKFVSKTCSLFIIPPPLSGFVIIALCPTILPKQQDKYVRKRPHRINRQRKHMGKTTW